MNFNDLQSNVISWAEQRNLFQNPNKLRQCLKTVSETGELADAVAKSEDIKDHVGDIIVTLIILSHMHQTSVEECLNVAYQEIKSRTGKTVDGLFIKD
jgi:NTP pyrophosphatase (non-canonical NTP hydrolase)